jgi:hypothetical protein
MRYGNVRENRKGRPASNCSSVLPVCHVSTVKEICTFPDTTPTTPHFSVPSTLVRPYYCEDNGRPSADPIMLFKMLLIGCLFGVRSERQFRDGSSL